MQLHIKKYVDIFVFLWLPLYDSPKQSPFAPGSQQKKKALFTVGITVLLLFKSLYLYSNSKQANSMLVLVIVGTFLIKFLLYYSRILYVSVWFLLFYPQYFQLRKYVFALSLRCLQHFWVTQIAQIYWVQLYINCWSNSTKVFKAIVVLDQFIQSKLSMQ